MAQWFDPSVFSTPATGSYGTFGRNALIGPGLSSTNAALLKNFPIARRENTYLQIRLEAFSVFNTPIFKNPTNTLGANLGRITSTSGCERQLQIAAKVVF